MTFCSICERPAWGVAAHPCCELWDRLTPGKSCGGCGASDKYWAELDERRGRRKKTV